MIQSITSFICQHPDVFITILILLGTAIYTFGRFSERIKHLEKESGSIDSKLDTLINCFNRLIGKLENIKELKGVLDNIYYQVSSPKTLTDAGKQMMKDSGLEDFINQNKEELMKKVNETKPKTEYDIEQNSSNIMLSLSNDSRINQIKDYAFKNGKDLNLMLMASGLYLRDIVISEAKNN